MTHRRLVLAILAGCSFAACAPEPVYVAQPPPPPPRALTITAQRRQSQRQQDRDKADCQRIATGQASSSESWAQVFAGCMGGRGYMVE